MNKIGSNALSLLLMLSITTISGLTLSSSTVSGTKSSTNAAVTVPEACTMTGTGMNSHIATINPNTYEQNIGKTTFTVVCNDSNGFSIYAVGYTGDSMTGNNTKLIGSSTQGMIDTKAYASGDTASNWSMKVTKVTDSTVSYNPANMSIQNSFDSWHTVPSTYTKVAEYHASTGSSTTDTTLGAKVETTYASYIASNQPADVYEGQVKYTLIHPYNETSLTPQSAVAGCINYFANTVTAVGTMGCHSVTDGNTTKLFASNFSRDGYGFAGWSDAYDYATNPNANFYGPNEDIVVPTGTTANGLSLYAVWIKSAGNLQDTAKVAELCGSNGSLTAATYSDEDDADESTWSITADLSSISALTDTRDNQTYAIAKLTDGNCWMIENLRLSNIHTQGGNTVPTTLTVSNTNNPLNDGDATTPTVILKHNYVDTQTFANLSPTSSTDYNSSTAPDGWCDGMSSWCYDQSRLRTDNTIMRVTFNDNSTDMSNHHANFYSYGNYYNWYSATAGHGTYSKSTGSTDGDLCPFGWHLPTGHRYNDATGEYGLLSNSLGGYKNANNVAQSMSSSTTPTGAVMSQRLRHFPNNLLYTGGVVRESISSRGNTGSYWSSLSSNRSSTYYLYLSSTNASPGSTTAYKYYGYAARCIATPSTPQS